MDLETAINQILSGSQKITEILVKTYEYFKTKHRRKDMLDNFESTSLSQNAIARFTRRVNGGRASTMQDAISNINSMIMIREEMILQIEISINNKELSKIQTTQSCETILELSRSLKMLISFFVDEILNNDNLYIEVDRDIGTLLMATEKALEILNRHVNSYKYDDYAFDSGIFQEEYSVAQLNRLCQSFRMMVIVLKSMPINIIE